MVNFKKLISIDYLFFYYFVFFVSGLIFFILSISLLYYDFKDTSKLAEIILLFIVSLFFICKGLYKILKRRKYILNVLNYGTIIQKIIKEYTNYPRDQFQIFFEDTTDTKKTIKLHCTRKNKTMIKEYLESNKVVNVSMFNNKFDDLILIDLYT